MENNWDRVTIARSTLGDLTEALGAATLVNVMEIEGEETDVVLALTLDSGDGFGYRLADAILRAGKERKL